MAAMGSSFKSSMTVFLVSVLLSAKLAMCDDEGAPHSLVKRQVRPCPAGIPCKNILQCKPMLDLLRTQTPQAFSKIRENLCAIRRGSFSVCCDETPSSGGENLLPKNCHGTTATRILGGEEVSLGSMPFIAHLGFTRGGTFFWGCGGALINERYVLTAAHCFDPTHNFGAILTRLVLGEHDKRTSPDCKNLNTGQRNCAPKEQDFTSFPGGSIISHESYNTNTAFADIALIRLERPAVITTFVAPICLPPANQDARAFLGGRKATAAGWGFTTNSPNAIQSDVLLSVDLPYVDRAACAPHYQVPVGESQICFGGEKDKDTCKADSGGPLIASNTNSPPFFMLGLTSFGQRQCGTQGVPAVYTDIAHYRNWIVSKLRP